MKCEYCSYWWQEEYEERAGCHYSGPDNWTPCAYEEQEEESYEEEEEPP